MPAKGAQGRCSSQWHDKLLKHGVVCAQRPTEEFFAESFGLPLTMNPKFEDLSCEMIFGQARPAFLVSCKILMCARMAVVWQA